GRRGQLSQPDYQDLHKAVPFESSAIFGGGRVTLTGGIDADRVTLILSGAPLLRMLGARAVVGRLIDERDEGHDVVVISQRLWQSTFHADPDIVGRPIGISGRSASIVGVVASDLDFGSPVGGGAMGSGFSVKDVDLWTPFNLDPRVSPNRSVSTYQAIVKLKRDQTLAAAQTAVDVVGANLARAYPTSNRNRGFRLTPL